MKAAIIKQYGEVKEIVVSDQPKPKPRVKELLVQVISSGLNPVDAKLREGHLQELVQMNFPRILGGDVAGIVTELGPEANDFKIGDEVYFSVPLGLNGGNAEYVTVNEDIVALKPKTIDFSESATLPVVALTAIQALRDFSGLKSGEKVLIHAGSGGVGRFAIQYAKYLGAEVYTTASPKNEDELKKLGADHVINYREVDFLKTAQNIGGFDVVFETVGGENYLKSIKAAKENGRVPAIVNPPSKEDQELANRKNVKTDFMLLEGRRSDLELIADLIDNEKFQTRVGKSFSLEQSQEAHMLLASSQNHGKIVITP